jgi:methylmalonyl-CoA mutase N-terminal domain/subunit
MDLALQQEAEEFYHKEKLATAEERQIAKLAVLRRERSDAAVSKALTKLESSARDSEASVMPALIDCVKAEATLQEMCDVMREAFGEAEPARV